MAAVKAGRKDDTTAIDAKVYKHKKWKSKEER